MNARGEFTDPVPQEEVPEICEKTLEELRGIHKKLTNDPNFFMDSAIAEVAEDAEIIDLHEEVKH